MAHRLINIATHGELGLLVVPIKIFHYCGLRLVLYTSPDDTTQYAVAEYSTGVTMNSRCYSTQELAEKKARKTLLEWCVRQHRLDARQLLLGKPVLNR